ncbi:MAG: NAD(P)H-dependent glycerol-3-phosphate dehydrogenase [Oscillospiraceae bacterium]|nr:NAD(P)H-dependent glycerol-3-phosphate dehydrogenase [Oscillospiraceae bacterium]
MKISVLGCGRWASFLCWYLQTTGHETLIWGRPGSVHLEQLRLHRRNEYLALPDEASITDDLECALEFGEILLISISAQGIRSFLQTLPVPFQKPIVLCMKGLEADTGLRLTEVAAQVLGKDVKTAVWAGPGHVQSFVKGIPNCMVIDSADSELTKFLADSLGGNLIRFYYGADIIGTEIGAASKNVIGIAAGMLDGLGLSCLKGVLMARGTREISRLTQSLGGKEITIYGLCHLGDYEATLFSPYSQNRKYGESFIKNEPYGHLAEGVETARSLCRLSLDCGVDLPISQAVHDTLSGKQNAKDSLSGLFLRSVKPEF